MDDMPKPPVPADVAAVLAKPNPCVMGMLKANGDPVTVATWYLWEDGRVLVNLDEGRARLAYLRNDPRVSLTVLDSETWYHAISLRGRVASLTDDTDLSDIDRISQHYGGQPYPVRDRGRVSAWIDVHDWHEWGKR
jgi:PPOX class probable F420-dependent enzyme